MIPIGITGPERVKQGHVAPVNLSACTGLRLKKPRWFVVFVLKKRMPLLQRSLHCSGRQQLRSFHTRTNGAIPDAFVVRHVFTVSQSERPWPGSEPIRANRMRKHNMTGGFGWQTCGDYNGTRTVAQEVETKGKTHTARKQRLTCG